ncbi:MAG: response regulator [Candidatus Bathyarchaeota archaeon]|nr:response regulator [Candidatus Bathyarchaeota archaeon]
MSIFRDSILIVEGDESAKLMLLLSLSRECSYSVAVSTAQDAVDKCAAYDFDVVILDAMMPRTPVAELLPRLVERCPETQFIVVQETLDREAIQESIRLGACDYVTKPFSIRDVVARVQASMARKRLTADKRQPPSSGTRRPAPWS